MRSSSFDDFYMPSSDGLRLHARLYGEADGDRVPLVCLPGLTRTAQDFHAMAEILSSDPYHRRVVVVDYRGRGGSAHDPDWRHYSVPVEAVDVRQMLATLGIKQAVFVGTSRGGLITMLLAITQNSLIKASVINDIGPVIEVTGLQRIESYVGKGTMPKDWGEAVERLRASNADFTDLTEAEWLDFAGIVYEKGADGFRLAYDPALGKTLIGIDFSKPLPPAWPMFEALRSVPVLAIRGENSDLLSEETLAEMGKRHGNLEIVRVPGEGHAPFLGRERTARAIADFVMRMG